MNTKQFERVFKALGNKRRLDIVFYLTAVKEATVGEIAQKIKLSFKATSKHLLLLRNAGVVDRDQRSLAMYYRIDKSQPSVVSRIISLVSNSRE